MNKKYTMPKVELKEFKTEDVITASGAVNNPLTALATKTFSNSDANTTWNAKTQK